MIDRVLEIFKRLNILKYVSYMLIIVAVSVIIIAFLPEKKTPYSSAEIVLKNSATGIFEYKENETKNSTISVKTFTKNGYPNIYYLIGKYYDALMSNDDSKLSKYTDSIEDIDPLKRTINSKYIESYQSFDYYTMTGMIERTYIVVVLYHVKYKNIATITTYLDYLYIDTDLSGNLFVKNKPVSDEISAYNGLMYESNIIKGLAQMVANEYDAALKNDQQLADFVNRLQN